MKQPADDPTLRAGEAAEVLGVGVQTLHFYERERLIPPPPRTASGYRLYTPELIDRLQFIRKAQALGLSLDQVREILDLVDHGATPCARVRAALVEQLEEIDRRIEELQRFREELVAVTKQAATLAGRESRGHVCPIVERAPMLHPIGRARVQTLTNWTRNRLRSGRPISAFRGS
jgi:DNA-binding transcriptional MerR regulator